MRIKIHIKEKLMKSPGHQKFSDHNVREERVTWPASARFNNATIVESNSVIKALEDKAPPHYYFPRIDLRMEARSPTATTSEFPFKGVARHFALEADGQVLRDAVWTYETPHDERIDLARRVAFDDDKYAAIAISAEH
jgi:uncharacterized protein (DUF427 family)